ncbi:hypothetical protein B4U80_11679, partial [Leptotrombidium deliense]
MHLLNTIDSMVDKTFDVTHMIAQHVCLTTIDVLTGIYNRDFLWNEIDNVLDFIHLTQKAATTRIVNPFLWSDFIYALTQKGKELQLKYNCFIKTFEALKNKDVIAGNKDDIYSLIDQINKLRQYDSTINDITPIHELLGFLIAGYETSALTIIAALFFMGVDEEVQNKAREEIKLIFEENKNEDL